MPFEHREATLHRLTAGRRLPLHRRDGSLCLIVLDGVGTLDDPSGSYLARTAFIAVRRAPYTGELAASPDGLRLLLLLWDEEGLRSLGRAGLGVSESRTLFGRASVELAWRIAAELRRPDRFSPDAVAMLSTGVAISLSRYASRHHGQASDMARRARRMLEKNLAQPIRMDALARGLGISPAYLSRTFRRSFGMSPKEFVHWRRTVRARKLLLATGRSIEAVAAELGYHDASHLTRRFRRWTGTTPGAFRRRHKAAGEP